MRLLARMLCRLTGHRRGRRLKANGSPLVDGSGYAHFECPRCSATWTRKIRKVKAAT